ncbi:MAG: AGE family epimerase/isomerase [Paludibacter sp.]|jgi:mannose/cellobiose epimerase-like protein (N-acyl-D-glucosamine 2-epimerase family)|nr:AGE family epimerase/isomerase [Paludibacter sp.]
MKKSYILILLALAFVIVANGQYVVKSKHILQPELNIEYVRSNADFWIQHAYDYQYGGFFSNIDRYGNVTTTTPQRSGFGSTPYKRKSLIAQSRHGYGFTRAFMMTGDEKYLTYAQSALDFLFDYGWDKVNEGWYAFAQADGTIDITQNWSPDLNEKWSFQQHYALLGIVANYEATRNSKSQEFMLKGINSINNNMWDARKGYEGYFSTAGVDWKNKKNKGFTATIDAITTNAELNYLITQDAAYKSRLLELADMIVKYFIPQIDNPNVKVLYPEQYTTNWVVDLNASKNGNVGHFIKTAWCLGRAYLCDTTKVEYKNAANKILNKAWTYKNGDVSIWDHVNGGPFNEINILTGEWTGSKGKVKEYWVVEQGFTAPMINYYISKNDTYLEMADQSIGFFMEHMVDSVDGEIFYQLSPDGTIVNKGVKGDDYKSGYHSIEMGYYAYLYSSLYYLKQPAELYYKFEPAAHEQSISLTPIPMQEGLLKIKSVTLNEEDFPNFDPFTRTLNIAANQGGKFKVTFEASRTQPNSVIVQEKNIVRMYPMPAKEYVRIDTSTGISKVSVLGLNGHVIIQQNAGGSNSVNIELNNVQSGVYLLVVEQPDGSKEMKKLVKQ